MTGLKSGSGDDLWGDDGDDGDGNGRETAGEKAPPDTEANASANARTDSSDADEEDENENRNENEDGDTVRTPVETTESSSTAAKTDAAGDASTDTGGPESNDAAPAGQAETKTNAEGRPTVDVPTDAGHAGGTDEGQPYIVRRAVKDKSVQFERDERLTFFVHDDVAEGERDLRTSLESTVGRSVPKFDLREAVYRAALRNEEDVLTELLRMGYAVDAD